MGGRRLNVLVIAAVAWLAATPAQAHHVSQKKAMWGPMEVRGQSAFPLYHRLGVGIYQMSLSWRDTAPTRPARPSDPRDPAYSWPTTVDAALRKAGRRGMKVLLMVMWTPPWANGGRTGEWAPDSAQDLADFMTAAARRYPGVRHWMVWGEPTRQPNFMPLDPETRGERLTRAEARAPRKYARMLDASYGALKSVRRRNIVIGGNSYSTGDISPQNWIRGMKLRDGSRPRMDMYGHNAYSGRKPDLTLPLVAPPTGFADFSDLDTMFRWLDRGGYRDGRGRRLPVFISEWSLPTDHPNHEMNFYVDRSLQARWLADALRWVRGTPRIASLGWFSLLDDPPRSDGLEVNRGLMNHTGTRKKPAFRVFAEG
jgi:hypothetical protein